MDSKYKKIAKVGFVAKGSIYIIIGVLSLLTALNLGGQMSGKTQVFEWIQKQAYGQVLLIAMALGLIAYAFWRYIEVTQDPEDIGNDKKGILKKVGFAVSGLSYIAFAGIAIKAVISSQSSGNSSLIKTLGPTVASIILIIVGLGLLAKAIFHLKKVFEKDFLDEFAIQDLKYYKLLKNLGYFGFTARGLVVMLLSYFFLRAGISSRGDKEIKSLSDAFSFLENSDYGMYLAGFAAAGLLCYGLFVLAMAKFKKFS
ncbi:DUF1206 domain-containing protein [Haloflavibacter putidus]|uniref:DUF1206 domain-containing protein n=1 Tax=Haloflavibacter putidus TaxID=2576776 RepID=A0A507ZR68_9FLAO|nr:DUF1206 domain-containing protein [Haloflavibacter putidus]TQD40256.1 DUF1206 domain-containing protein [Haloflavibacter putidus]